MLSMPVRRTSRRMANRTATGEANETDIAALTFAGVDEFSNPGRS